jgi:cytoskeletal protein RodZ
MTRMTTAPLAPRSKKDRDAGLLRIKQLTRWSIAGALAGTGLFAGLATHTAVTSSSTATKTQAVQQSTSSAASDDSGDSTATTAAPTTTTPTTVTASNSPPMMTSGAS